MTVGHRFVVEQRGAIYWIHIASAPAHAPAPVFVVASAFSASHPNSSLLLKAKRSHSVLD
jgi:hypothetical protein